MKKRFQNLSLSKKFGDERGEERNGEGRRRIEKRSGAEMGRKLGIQRRGCWIRMERRGEERRGDKR